MNLKNNILRQKENKLEMSELFDSQKNLLKKQNHY